jgi:hypothetical protein
MARDRVGLIFMFGMPILLAIVITAYSETALSNCVK